MPKKVEVCSRPIEYTLSIIGGKWKIIIMFWIWKSEVLRYGELMSSIKGITHKMLSTQLKELEKDNIIIRTEYQQIPPKVEYTLTDKGLSLMPILSEMCNWGKENLKENECQNILP
ncbi:MAG: transcriptional regulator [Anaerocolumna sp.]|jgi:DNA-binding HxlR family transcriptional regulator|nr:transcriptional regulator [Anaerocolumna sp.]